MLRHEILEAYGQERLTVKLRELASPMHAIPEHTPVSKVLNEFLRRQEHLFLVVDEYGQTAGLVSLEDAVETLLGVEIVGEDDVATDMRALASLRAEQRRQHRVKLFKALRQRESEGLSSGGPDAPVP
ncbi:MAG: CBS domain-containing protein [Planctomycetota bacterium]|nr:CBS domain-containing protein [Planctomycetota bacterium]